MRRTALEIARAVRTGSALAALCALAPEVGAQEPLDGGPTDGMFSLPRSQDDIAEWQAAQQDIAARAYDSAVERLHRLLRDGSRGVLPVLDAPDRWIGLRQSVIRTLRDLPDEARQAYERLCRREAGRTFDLPLAGLDDGELHHLATGYPTSTRGLAARVRLGDLALQRGDGLVALQHFRAALDAARPETAGAVRTRMRAADLLVRAQLGRLSGDDELATAIAAATAEGGRPGWIAYGGGYDGLRPMDDPVGESAEPYRVPIHADGFELNDFSMHVVGDLDGLYVNDGHRIRAVDPIGRRVLWDAPGPMVDSDDVRDAREAINSDIVLACATSPDIVVAALQVPNKVIGADQTLNFRQVINIIRKIPSRRLFAFDRTTGKRLWAHWDYEDGPISKHFAGHDACSAPIVHGDTVYVATHNPTGAISFYVAAYDLQTGTPRWRRLICSSQQEVNMFGNARQEFAAGPIALFEGVVYGTTNLGVCFAVDAEDGDVRWISEYPTIPLPPTQLRDQQQRQVFFANNPIAINDGVLATTPLDSEFALGLDIETGRVLWHLPYDARDVVIHWMLGALGDEFVFSGIGIVAVKARPDESGRTTMRLLASVEALGEDSYRPSSIPRGALTADRVWYIGSDDAFRILDARGSRDPRMARLQLAGRGNLLMVDGIVATIRDGLLLTWSDVDALIRDARRQLSGTPGDPEAVLRLATLQRARGGFDPSGPNGEGLERLLLDGLDAAQARGLGSGSRIHQKLAEGLFELSIQRAEAAKDPTTARRLFEVARERALQPRQWLRAQQQLLARSADDSGAYLAELQRMAERFPEESFVFPEVGRVPIGVYALWSSVGHLADPRAAVRACQRLLDRYGDVPIGDRTAADRAREALEALVRAHGRDVLAEVEVEAARELERAGDDPELLRRVVERFPLSDAARTASTRRLDLALATGDLAAAAHTFAELAAAGGTRPGSLRRLIEAARNGGNPALARALAIRLVAEAGDRASDLPIDGGRTYAQVFAELPAPPTAEPPLPNLPLQVVAELLPPNSQSSYSFAPVRAAEGFAAPEPLPLFATIDDTQLFAFDLARRPFDQSDPRAVVPLTGNLDGSLVLLCGDTAIGVDTARAFGVDLRSGLVAWEIPSRRAGGLSSLGVRAGVLHLFSYDPGARGDGGSLLGVEPTSGAVLFERDLGDARAPTPPVSAAGAIWLLDAADPDSPLFRTLDPLDGHQIEATPIPAEAQRFLSPAPPFRDRVYDPLVQTGFFADDRNVYLPVDLGASDQPSRLVALRRGSGEIAWRWTGLPGSTIQRAGLHGDRIVLFEKGSSRARLLILRADGTEDVTPFEFQSMAVVRNWDRRPYVLPVPDAVLVTDASDDGNLRFTCVSVQPGGPRFQVPLDNVSRMPREPQLGAGFVVLPLSRSGRRDTAIEVLDLRTRSGALPGGERALRLGLSSPLRVFSHGRYTVVETYDALRVLGSKD